MAVDIVCVFPGMFPAIIIVAPNSPSALAKVSINPENTPGTESGSKIFQKIFIFEIPRVLAANNISSLTCSKAPKLVLYIIGRLTTMAEITAAVGVKIMLIPKLFKSFPIIEFFPNIINKKKSNNSWGENHR